MLAGTIARSSTAALPLPLRSSRKYNCEGYRGVDTARVKPAIHCHPSTSVCVLDLILGTNQVRVNGSLQPSQEVAATLMVSQIAKDVRSHRDGIPLERQ
jgi:hypothetical protein